MKLFLFIVLLISIALVYADIDIPFDVSLNKMDRSVNISRNVELEGSNFHAENTGNKPIDKIIWVIPREKVPHFALIEAYSDSTRESLSPKRIDIDFDKYPQLPYNHMYFTIPLLQPLEPGNTTTITVLITYVHTLIPVPQSIKQSNSQRILYTGTTHAFSLYPIPSQRLTIFTASKNIDSYAPRRLATVDDSKITFGPFDTLSGPYTIGDEVVVHAENNFPFATMLQSKRQFDISHWGTLTTREEYLLEHTGARLDGPFHRNIYERGGALRGRSSFNTLRMILPYDSYNIQYGDCNGNVSTSRIAYDDPNQQLVVDIAPRYPLFGGWKTDFLFSYQLPLSQVLKYYDIGTKSPIDNNIINNKPIYQLALTFGLPFDDVVSNDLNIQVLLPSGATDISWDAPFDLESVSISHVSSMIPLLDRPLIDFKQKNIVSRHHQTVYVYYTLPSYYLLKEPLIFTAMIFILLLIIIVLSRFDFSVGTYHVTSNISPIIDSKVSVGDKTTTNTSKNKDTTDETGSSQSDQRNNDKKATHDDSQDSSLIKRNVQSSEQASTQSGDRTKSRGSKKSTTKK